MKKKIKDCSYKELCDYYKEHYDTYIGAMLSAFRSQWVRNEHSWAQRQRFDFKLLFNKDFLEREIEL